MKFYRLNSGMSVTFWIDGLYKWSIGTYIMLFWLRGILIGCYVGMSTRSIIQRWTQHKISFNNLKCNHKIQNLLKEYPNSEIEVELKPLVVLSNRTPDETVRAVEATCISIVNPSLNVQRPKCNSDLDSFGNLILCSNM